MIAFSIIVVVLGLQGMTTVSSNMSNIMDNSVPATDLVAEMTRDFLIIRLATVAMLVLGEDKEKFFNIQKNHLRQTWSQKLRRVTFIRLRRSGHLRKFIES